MASATAFLRFATRSSQRGVQGLRLFHGGNTVCHASPVLLRATVAEAHRPQPNESTFSDVLSRINQKKDVMNATNPLFPLLRNEDYPAETRLSFAPYMMSFSIGAADFLSSELHVAKPKHQLNTVEHLVNTFIEEDDFHYNYYIRDLVALGYTMENFGDLEGVLRFTWGVEGLPTRRLVNACNRALGYTDSPIVRMIIAELLEAGLVELFTTVYKDIVKRDHDLPMLHYFGDTHVHLEANHQVTAQFSGKDVETRPKDEWKHEELTPDVIWACNRATDDILERFNEMYLTFHKVILDTHEGKHVMEPKKFHVTGDPPVAQIHN